MKRNEEKKCYTSERYNGWLVRPFVFFSCTRFLFEELKLERLNLAQYRLNIH